METIIDKTYRVLRLLNTGSMGEIWEVESLKTGKRFAMKKIKEKFLNKNTEGSLRFCKESEILKSLEHKNIVRIYEIGEVEGQYYFIMDKISGINLKTYIKNQGMLNIDIFLQFALEITETLEYIHKKKIIHSDIKPSNVIITEIEENMRIKLVDFGISRLLNFPKIEHKVLGTFYYMAPEQSGMLYRKIDQRTDLYSLGIMFYEMLSGILPYTADSVYSLMYYHVVSTPISISNFRNDIPPILERIINKLINKEQKSRYESAGLLLRDLQRIKDTPAGKRNNLDFIPGFSPRQYQEFSSFPMIGRKDEKERILQLFEKSKLKTGSTLIISGPAGSGKTRLLTEIERDVIAAKGLYLYCTFTEYTPSEPYSQLLESINRFLGVMKIYHKSQQVKIQENIQNAVKSYLPLLFPYLPQLQFYFPDKRPVIQPSNRGFAVFGQVIISLLRAISKSFPAMVICFDNLQWADEATQNIVVQLAREDLIKNELLLVSLRTEWLDTVDKRHMVAALTHSFSVLNLPPLEEENIYQLVCDFFGQRKEEYRELAGIIAAKTNGNVFFVLNFLNKMNYKKDVNLDMDFARSMPYSNNVAQIITHNIEELSEEIAQLLSLCAVWGKDFILEDIKKCFTDFDMEQMQHAAAEAEGKRIVQQHREAISFTHDIIHEVLYNRLQDSEKKKYHEKIAAFLEEEPRNNTGLTYSIYRHYSNTDNIQKALEYAKKSGLMSFRHFSYYDALNYFKEAHSLAQRIMPNNNEEHFWLFNHIGEAYSVIGLFQEAVNSFQKALELTEKQMQKAAVLRNISHCLQASGKYDQAINILTFALKKLNHQLPATPSKLRFGAFVQFLKQVKHSRNPNKYINRESANPESPDLMLQNIYSEITLAAIWELRQVLLVYSHFKALNICDRAGISQDSSILLLTHIAVLASLKMPVHLTRKIINRIRNFFVRIKKDLDKTDYPFPAYALYLGVHASFDFPENAVEEAKKAISLIEQHNSISMYREITNCCAQVFERFGKMTELSELAEDYKLKGKLYKNEQFSLLGELYEGVVAFYTGETRKAVKILPQIEKRQIYRKDGVDAHYTRMILFKAFCRDNKLTDAAEIAERSIKLIKEEKQVHPWVISRIYIFYMEELILSYLPQPSVFYGKKFIIRKIKSLYRICKSIQKVWHIHTGNIERLSGLFHYCVKKRNKKAIEAFERSLAYYKNHTAPYEEGLAYYHYALCLKESNEDKAVKLLEKAYILLETIPAYYEMQKIEDILKKIHGREEASWTDKDFEDSTPGSGGSSFTAARELHTILDIIGKISSIKDLNELYYEIIKHGIELIGAEQGELFLREKGELKSVYKLNAPRTEPYGTCMSIVNHVERACEPLVVHDAEHHVLFKRDAESIRWEIKSVLCVPMLVKNESIGIFYASSRKISEAFSEHQRDVLSAMTAQAAIAIENARLFRETKTLQNYFYNILDSLPGVILALDINGRITHVNDAGARFFQKTKQKLRNEFFWDVTPFLRRYKNEFYQVLKKGSLVEFSKEYFENKYYRITLFPIIESDSGGAVFKLNDITEEEKIQNQLIQAQKMDALGTMVGGIAHDFNNILTGITGVSSYLLEEAKEKINIASEEIREELKSILDLAKRAGNMVKQLLTLSRRNESEMVPVDLVQSIQNVRKICHNTLDKSIDFKVSLPETSAYIMADPTQIEQAILNLCINAGHAMTIMRKKNEDWGGKLSIQLSMRELQGQQSQSSSFIDKQAWWCIKVTDEGIGMSEDIRQKLFEPFFSTKGEGRGTGLGLSMVYNIVQSFQGNIDVESDIGKGAQITMCFPVLKPVDYDRMLEVEQDYNHTGSGTILLVDDEQTILKPVSKFLKAAGYTVLTCKNGKEAISLYREYQKEIKIVILDLLMPVLSGRAAYEELKKINPNIKIILSSGYAYDKRIKELQEMGVSYFLKKPYTKKELFKVLEEVVRSEMR